VNTILKASPDHHVPGVLVMETYLSVCSS